MKFVPVLASALAVACVTVSTIAGAQDVVAPYEEAGFAPIVGQEVKLTPALRRQLQAGSGTTDASATTTPETTTATPTTTTPATTTATPTTTAPTTTTPTPTTTTATSTPTAATPTATSATPDATTATPTSTNATPEITTATPSSTTATPSTNTATPTTTSAASSAASDTTASAPSPAESTTTSNSGSASSASADTSSSSSMSTGAVIGIVVGIVAAVAIIATIIMCVIRRKREADDDPLSPFELSMDKGYNPTPGGFTSNNSYNPRVMGAAGAAGASASGSMSNTRTPPADAVAAGVAYSQFYDNAATSPGSMNRLESNVDAVQTDPSNHPNATTNGTNLWLSAMEPKDNDSYLSAHESPRSSRNSSRNSYEISSNQNFDVDQSSQISGNSNKESDDFPDHHEDNDSARGSYEL